MDNSEVHLLVCDDELEVRDMLKEYLGKKGYRVTSAAGGEELRAILALGDVDLIIMDINMPKEDGLSILRSLRPENMTPVIMLTAAGDVVDRIIGLEMGADDYLGKPVDLRELEARVKALLRRNVSKNNTPVSGEDPNNTMFGDYRLETESAKLFAPDGAEISITAMEYSLLKVFAENKGRVLNRDQILEKAHDRSWDPFDRSIDIRISRLRRKLESNPEKPAIIKTVRGIGYLFDPENA